MPLHQGPWGSETQIRLRRDAVVLVDEPTEQVPPPDIERADRDRDGDRGFSQRRGEAEGAMGAPAVVVLGIGPERPIEMPPVEDERQRRRATRCADREARLLRSVLLLDLEERNYVAQ